MPYRETEKMRNRKTQSRQRIFDCAHQCVFEGGFRNAQISQVAKAAGVATGTIYRYFDSKQELFAEIFRTATQREVDLVAEALSGTGDSLARLESALEQFAVRSLRAPVMAWSLLAEPVDPRVEAERLSYRKAYAQLFEKAINEGIQEGSIPPQDARHTSTCLVGAIAESLVGPLSPARAGTAPSGNQTQQTALVESILCFCRQGLTGARR